MRRGKAAGLRTTRPPGIRSLWPGLPGSVPCPLPGPGCRRSRTSRERAVPSPSAPGPYGTLRIAATFGAVPALARSPHANETGSLDRPAQNRRRVRPAAFWTAARHLRCCPGTGTRPGDSTLRTAAAPDSLALPVVRDGPGRGIPRVPTAVEPPNGEGSLLPGRRVSRRRPCRGRGTGRGMPVLTAGTTRNRSAGCQTAREPRACPGSGR